MRNFIAMTVAVLLASAPAAAAGVFTIDFEDQPGLAFVGNPLVYPDATFTSGGEGNYITQTNTNDLCPYIGIECTGVLTVDFSNIGPYFFTLDVSFTVTGDNASGLTGSVDVFRDAALLGTVDIMTDGVFESTDLVDLTSFGEITRLVISSTDLAGFSYDNFSYNIIVKDPLPSPSALALFGLGAAALGFARRR